MTKHSERQAKSAERQALAAAIAAAADATARRQALVIAREQAAQAVYRARQQVEEAGARVEAATAGAADRLVLVAMGGDEGRPDLSVRQAGDQLRDAEYDLEAAIEARARINTMSESTEADVAEVLRRAAIGVVRAEHAERAQTIIGEAEELCVKLSRLCGQLSWLFRNADMFERNLHGAPLDSRVHAVLSYRGDDAAFQAGHSDLEKIVAGLATDAGAQAH